MVVVLDDSSAYTVSHPVGATIPDHHPDGNPYSYAEI